MDAGYKSAGKIGTEQTSETEWQKIGIDKLDRRSLYAIASNQGSAFSEIEVTAAKFFMTKEQGAAMAAVDPVGSNFADQYKASINFLDNVSDEERASLEWAQSRASSQVAYKGQMQDEGRLAENVDTGSLVVELFAKAYGESTALNDPSKGADKMPSWLEAVDLWRHLNETKGSLP